MKLSSICGSATGLLVLWLCFGSEMDAGPHGLAVAACQYIVCSSIIVWHVSLGWLAVCFQHRITPAHSQVQPDVARQACTGGTFTVPHTGANTTDAARCRRSQQTEARTKFSVQLLFNCSQLDQHRWFAA